MVSAPAPTGPCSASMRVCRFPFSPLRSSFLSGRAAPQVKFECKMRKKVSPARLHLSLQPPPPCAVFPSRIPFQNDSSPRNGRHTSSTERDGSGRGAQEIWTASLSLSSSSFVPGQLSLLLSPSSFSSPCASSLILDGLWPAWMEEGTAQGAAGRSQTDRKFCPLGLGVLR